MGIEYQISCAPENFPKIQELLDRLGGEPSQQFPQQIEFRFQPSRPDEMPDATVVLDIAGIYLCDWGGVRESVAVLFRRIVDEALTFAAGSEGIVITRL